MNADGEIVDLFPPRHEREGLLEGRAGGHLLDAPSIEIAPEHAVEVEEHGVSVERLAIVEGDAGAQRELPGERAHRLPGEGEARHRLAPGVDVHEALVDLPDIRGADGAHPDARVHVRGVIGEGYDELALGIGGRVRGACAQRDGQREKGQGPDSASLPKVHGVCPLVGACHDGVPSRSSRMGLQLHTSS